ncbi:uncharacterized protein LOC107841583 [Capsicum annuum]|uniref:uncharacterized protein LOC107841583 n=1 Tax=Capsicum annuum TaxID=4072 RepID=UPI001FB12712|nr:uncharacterized protein LOC107841583 [Capsicum annuum]
MVHRMLMYSTLCKVLPKANDRGIVEMITTGFTGQLKGWWDNYLTQDQKTKIIQSVVKREDGQDVMNAIYTLIINNIEHFSGRWSDNSESIRTLLQNLRCKTLTSWRWYKEVFLSRVMELTESNSSHWKFKFIDGLPMLFAERIKKTLRGSNVSINYEDYTYGNLIKVVTQEDIFKISRESYKSKKKYSDEKKSKKIKKKGKRKEDYESKKAYRKAKKTNTCYRCGRFGHFAKDCKVKSKIKSLSIDDDTKDSLCKILLNSSLKNSSPDHIDNEENDSTNEDLRVLHKEDYMPSDDECIPCKEGQPCTKKEEEDILYNIISQFQDIEINVLKDNKLTALLEMLKDLGKQDDKPSTSSFPNRRKCILFPPKKVLIP